MKTSNPNHKLIHSFLMGDVEDPYLMAAFPLGEFMNTEKGKWVDENVIDRVFYCVPHAASMGFKIVVYGEFKTPEAETYYCLKYRKDEDFSNW